MKRSMMCGEVRADHVGQTLVLQGWVHTVRDHGGLISSICAIGRAWCRC